MKKLYSILIMALLVLAVAPAVLAVSIGTGVSPVINTEDFEPIVWLCDSRLVLDDQTEPGRITPAICIAEYLNTSALCAASAPFTVFVNGVCTVPSLTNQSACEAFGNTWTITNELVERINNYAFEGEQIQWKVLVMDKNGINKIEDVFATIGDEQGAGNEIEVNCVEDLATVEILDSCNARILEENITEFDSAVMRYYTCTLTIETSESMYGEYWITVEAMDLSGLSSIMAENEYWFFNPVIALFMDGTMTFSDVRPGTSSYSNTMLVGNDADAGSGVMMDMFISGTDFYDSTSSGAMCPTTNQLSLNRFRYYVVNGAYNSLQDLNIDVVDGDRDTDAEGYTNIEYGIGFNNPSPFYNNAEILQAQQVAPYYTANLLAPGAEMAITFRLDLPEPCNGNFDTGSIYFWGEAI